MLLTGSEDRIARLWDVPTGLRLGPMLTHRGPALAAFRPKSKQIGTMSDDGLLRLWDVPAPVAGDMQHIQHWVESLTAKRLADNGVLQDLAGPALRQIRQR
jgi:WD40 repeat protein